MQNEPIIQQEPTITLPAIGIEHFLANFNILQWLNNKPIHGFLIIPYSLFGLPMVEHISKGD